jgi:hypothetical protein
MLQAQPRRETPRLPQSKAIDDAWTIPPASQRARIYSAELGVAIEEISSMAPSKRGPDGTSGKGGIVASSMFRQ